MSEAYREDGREDRSLLVVAFNRRVFGIDPEDGSVRWEHPVPGYSQIEIQIVRGRIFATTSEELHALDYPSGTLLGRAKIPDTYKGRPTMVIERDRIFIGSGGEVTCFDLSCNPLWSQGFEGKGIGAVALGFPGNLRQADDRGAK